METTAKKEPVKDPLIGTRLGNCEIRRKLGAGGMGAVYLAHHVTLDKPVAVKVMAAALPDSEENVERFKREARTAARLEHPNIVQVYDVSEFPGGYYIVMQYVDGKALDTILEERGRLPVQQSVALVRRIATALAAAHKAGVIHRDIKPANVLVSKDGVVKVLDFGLARSVESGQTLSSTGQIVGTPHYMAPEQAQGQKVDARTDIYALGATFYHLVTGTKVFTGDTPLAIVIKQIQDTPTPPHELNPEVTPAVSAVIAKMMAKDPGARHQSAEELIAALDTLKDAGATARTVVRGGAAPAKGGAMKLTIPLAVLGVMAAGAIAWAVFRSRPDTAPVDGGPKVEQPKKEQPKKEEPKPDPEKKQILRGVAEALEKLKSQPSRDQARELALAREIVPRLAELVQAIARKDEKAVEKFVMARAPLKGSEEEWRQWREKFLAEMRERMSAGTLEYAVLMAIDMQPVLLAYRGVLTVEWHAKPADGSPRVSAPYELVWGRDMSGAWVVVPSRPKRGS